MVWVSGGDVVDGIYVKPFFKCPLFFWVLHSTFKQMWQMTFTHIASPLGSRWAQKKKAEGDRAAEGYCRERSKQQEATFLFLKWSFFLLERSCPSSPALMARSSLRLFCTPSAWSTASGACAELWKHMQCQSFTNILLLALEQPGIQYPHFPELSKRRGGELGGAREGSSHIIFPSAVLPQFQYESQAIWCLKPQHLEAWD